MIRVGFTGTRVGLTFRQKVVLKGVLAEFVGKDPEGCEFHHGDCIGADAETAWLAKGAGYIVVVHPPTDERLRAFAPGDLVLPAEPYLDRNRAIVDVCSTLIAAPKDPFEQGRSGTWMTVRYAKRVGRPAIVVFPSGGIDRRPHSGSA